MVCISGQVYTFLLKWWKSILNDALKLSMWIVIDNMPTLNTVIKIINFDTVKTSVCGAKEGCIG